MSPPGSLRPFYAGYWFGGFNALTWMIGLGTPMVLLAQQLGATTFQVGLASAFVFLLLPLQVVSTAALARLGYKRQMVIAWSVRALFLLVPFGLALAAPTRPAPWMADLLVASVFGFCALRAFGVAAHIPWMAAILPLELRGRFFATDNSITSVVGVATLLLCAQLFVRLPPFEAFAWVYALCLAGSTLAVWNLTRLPSAPNPDPVPLKTLPGEARALFLGPGPFLHYLLLVLLGAVVTSSVAPFTAFYLRVEEGLATSRILAFTAAQFAGAIVGAWAIRHWIDRTSIRRFFQGSVLMVGLVEAFWLLFVSGVGELARLLPLAYFAFGAAFAISNAAHHTYLPELSSEAKRPISVAVFTAVMGLLSGIAPMAWGLALRAAGTEPRMHVDRFALFFAVGIALSALLVWLYARLPDPRLAARQAG